MKSVLLLPEADLPSDVLVAQEGFQFWLQGGRACTVQN